MIFKPGWALFVLVVVLCACVAACGSSEKRDPYQTIPFFYHTYESLGEDLVKITGHFPEVCRLHEIGNSVEGRKIWAVKISDNPDSDEGEPVVYIDGGTHGSEWIATEVALHIAKHLCENYGADAEVTGWVESTEIWVVPLLNPDGHVRVETGEFTNKALGKGRKNSAVLEGDECFGINLNRQFDYLWSEASSTDPCDNDFRGYSPFSEPEARAVRDLLLEKPPVAALHYHAFGELIHFTDFPDETELVQLMLQMANDMRDEMEAVYGHYYVVMGVAHAGMTAGWVSATFGAPAFTMELRPNWQEGEAGGGNALPEEQIRPTFNENYAALKIIFTHAIDGS